jgi:hypothetical protein
VAGVPEQERFWDAVIDAIYSRANDVESIALHGLEPLAADVLDRRGLTVPEPLRRRQQMARVATLMAPILLDRVRASCEGPILLLKGPEAAARYPQAARGFGDIDLLVPDARRTQAELLSAGFVEEEDPEGLWVGIHHLGRLRAPGSPLPIEVHSVPKWPDGLQPPPFTELFEGAVPSATGVNDVLAPNSTHHAVILAAHAWAHQPLGRVRDLVDVGAFRVVAGEDDLRQVAHRWGVSRMWQTTTETLDALLTRRATWPLRLWAGHLGGFRDQTVLETHLERLLAPLWGYRKPVAVRRVGSAVVSEVRPAFDEGWSEKLRRTVIALRRLGSPVRIHRHELGPSATRGQRRNVEPKKDGNPDDSRPDGKLPERIGSH